MAFFKNSLLSGNVLDFIFSYSKGVVVNPVNIDTKVSKGSICKNVDFGQRNTVRIVGTNVPTKHVDLPVEKVVKQNSNGEEMMFNVESNGVEVERGETDEEFVEKTGHTSNTSNFHEPNYEFLKEIPKIKLEFRHGRSFFFYLPQKGEYILNF